MERGREEEREREDEREGIGETCCQAGMCAQIVRPTNMPPGKLQSQKLSRRVGIQMQAVMGEGNKQIHMGKHSQLHSLYIFYSKADSQER